MKARAKEITGSYTVEGWRCKYCSRFYDKEEIVKGVCKYCIRVHNDLSR